MKSLKSFGPALNLIALLGIALMASACGPQAGKKQGRPTGNSLAQLSDSMDENGTYLCRLDFSYSSGGPETNDFAVSWGLHRTSQKRELLSDCTNSAVRSGAASQACLNAAAKTQCVNSVLLPNRGQMSSSGSLTSCVLEYEFRYNGTPYKDLTEKIESIGSSTADAVNQAVDQCMSRKGGSLDGCSFALLAGKLSCAHR